jgi:putative ABC transport system permease protein
MTFRDLITVSFGNLMRMKLRTSLTVSGVLIAIAAFVSMLSFAAGNQKNITRQFNDLGLLSTMQVSPKSDTAAGGKVNAAILDKAAFERLSKIPGVRLAYPYDAITVTVSMPDTTVATKALALPIEAARTKLFSRLEAGASFPNDSAKEVIVTSGFLKNLKILNPDSAIGRQIVLSTRVPCIDSAMAYTARGLVERGKKIVKEADFDTLLDNKTNIEKLIRTEANNALGQFMNGFLNAPIITTETLTICGVLNKEGTEHLRIESIIIPSRTALRLGAGGLSADPTVLLSVMQSGTLFSPPGENSGRSYPQITLDIEPGIAHKMIRDSVEAMGFRAFSFAEQFDQIRQFFVYFNIILGVIGLIALMTASLGIVNTMVMSILERKREIGVLISLGAYEQDIRLLFLVESGVIGAIGAIGGIIFGWIISRIASAVVNFTMAKQGIPAMELFALPLWLIAISFVMGVIVSMIAGLYPAGRAARVDPVEALRGE